MILVDLENFVGLEENEFLLKVFDNGNFNSGFMTKLNLNGTIPKTFLNWKPDYTTEIKDAYIFKEYFRSGWKFYGFRNGKSQNWVKLVHPEGFVVEIYQTEFDKIIKNHIIDEGRIEGMWKWESNKLVSN